MFCPLSILWDVLFCRFRCGRLAFVFGFGAALISSRDTEQSVWSTFVVEQLEVKDLFGFENSPFMLEIRRWFVVYNDPTK